MKQIWLIRHAQSRSQNGEDEDGRNPELSYQLSQASAPHVEFDTRLAESNWGIQDYYLPILPLSPPQIADPDRHHALLQPVEKRATELVNELLCRPEERFMLFGHWGIFVHIFQVFSRLPQQRSSLVAKMDNTGISLLEAGNER